MSVSVRIVNAANPSVLLTMKSLKEHPQTSQFRDIECKQPLDASKTYEENGYKGGDTVYQGTFKVQDEFMKITKKDDS